MKAEYVSYEWKNFFSMAAGRTRKDEVNMERKRIGQRLKFIYH